MPHVSFARVLPGRTYSRRDLAALWGYASFHALARGVVTPAGENTVILFVTENKKPDREPYQDRLVGPLLYWEGPTDHFAEDRMRPDHHQGEEIHVFYRREAKDDFTYLGQVETVSYKGFANRPSQFTFRVPA